MKSPSCKIVGIAVLLLVTSGGGASAGVVMAETSFAAGPRGSITENKTVYVQGNKQRIEQEGIAQVTDLDKNLVYIIDKNRRVFSEIPLQAVSSGQPEDLHGEAILTKTGNTLVIADHSCHEYRAVDGNKLEHATISACVSTNVPGAREIADFNRNMIARLGGHKSKKNSIRSDAPGLILEKQSVLSFRVPDPSQGNSYHTTSLIAATRVSKIQLTALAPDTFKPPVGYRKLPNRPNGAPPVDSSDSHPALQAFMRNLPTPSRLPTSS